jgi:hypothetical protein
MKDKVRKLKLKKLIQEYSFLLTDESYKKEVISETQSDFLKEIHEKKIELGLIKNKPFQEEINEESSNINDEGGKAKESDELNLEDDSKDSKDVNSNDLLKSKEKTKKSSKAKRLYREIVKKTHPDKANSNEHVDLYKDATSAYEENDLISLYFIASELDIDVELEEEDIVNINEKINHKRKELHNIELSYLWLWYNAKTQEQRDKVVALFISKN